MQSSTPSADTQRKRTSKIWIGLGLLLGLVLAAGVTLLVALRAVGPWLQQRAVDEARARGIQLEIGRFEWGLDGLTLTDCRVTLVGVDGVGATVQRIDASVLIGLGRTTIEQLDIDTVAAELTGSPAALGLALSDWTRRYPQAYSTRARAKNVSMTWRNSSDQEPWLQLSNAVIEPQEAGGVLHAQSAKLGHADLGSIGAQWTQDDAAVALGLGEANLQAAPVRIQVTYAAARPTLNVQLAPTPLRHLNRAFALTLADRDIVVSGETQLALAKGDAAEPVSGLLKLRLEGYVPPHPVELDGFVFGNTTLFESQLHVSLDRQQIRLDQTRVTAGAFALLGQGMVVRKDDSAELSLELRGNIGCAALAGAAAETRLGAAFGKWARRLANAALQGSVSVTVKISANSSNLEQARVARIIGVGCGLNPLDLSALQDFDLPMLRNLPPLDELLPELPPRAKLPESLLKLPPLPSMLPSGLPDLTPKWLPKQQGAKETPTNKAGGKPPASPASP